MIQAREKLSYEFGPFRLDAIQRVLFNENRPVSLTPKAFDTLLALVVHSGQLLTTEELMAQVWPDSFVEGNNLAQNISTLRKVLGAKFIETVPKRGYRFVADVKEIREVPFYRKFNRSAQFSVSILFDLCSLTNAHSSFDGDLKEGPTG